MFLVLLLTLLTVGIIVDALFMNRQSAALDDTLTRGASYALAKARTTAEPEALLQDVQSAVRAGGGDVYVLITLPDRPPVGTPVAPGARDRTEAIDTEQPKLRGAEVTLWSSTAAMAETRRSLDTTLLVVGLLGLAGAALLTVAITDVALRPLQVMVERANRIAGGERGLRMASPVTTTEVGQTAAAIDEMLNELEDSEMRAMAAESSAKASAVQMQSFLSDAAHELKTPLAGIQAAAESLMQLPDEAFEEREQLSFLLAREANRGGQLVNSLLEAARVDAGPELRPESLDLGDLAAAEKRRMALTHPRIDVVVQGPNLLVSADRQGITSVLRNLVDNGARAAAPDGALLVDLSTRPAQGDKPEMAVVRVLDSGPGIAPEDRDRVFGRLVRLSSTASTTKGSGLGLPIARGYARAHGGDVRYLADCGLRLPKDELGQPRPNGACFEFTLPLARMVQASEPRRAVTPGQTDELVPMAELLDAPPA